MLLKCYLAHVWLKQFYNVVDLLGLLKWRDNPNNLENSLKALMKVDGEEVVKVSILRL